MNRTEWTFDYQASRLAQAAVAKTNSHRIKLKWWEAKKVEVMAKVRESGIDIKDSVAASYSNTKGNFGPQIQIDAGMQRDLCECQDKILEHTRLISEYDGWRQVFEANPGSSLALTHDDWIYFFGE